MHNYWKKHSFDYTDGKVCKVISLLFNMLSRFVIAFLLESKGLLILWLQSSSAAILGPKKIKSVSVSIVSPSICHEVMGPDAMIFVFWMLSFFLTTDYRFIKKVDLGIGSGDFHLDSWLNTDGSDLLDSFRRAVQVNESITDPHLESIPSLRTFTTSFPCIFLRVLVGIQTVPFTLRFFSFAPLIRSAHTFSRDFTLQLVRVILIRWMATSGSTESCRCL